MKPITAHRTPKQELAKAKLADVVAVQLSLRNFWNPLVLWRTVKFLYQNHRRQRVLARMVKRQMGFNWRCSLPKKQQRQLGYLPKLS